MQNDQFGLRPPAGLPDRRKLPSHCRSCGRQIAGARLARHGGVEICATCVPSYHARYGQPFAWNFSPFRALLIPVEIRCADDRGVVKTA